MKIHKEQVLANLVVEFTQGVEKGENEEYDRAGKEVMTVSICLSPHWELYVDGAANQKGSRIRIVMISPEHITIKKSLRLNFSATNDKVGYEALMAGLNSVKKLGGKSDTIYCDLRLVVR